MTQSTEIKDKICSSLDDMIFSLFRVFRRAISTNPTSNFITLPNRPIVQSNGDIVQSPLKLHYWEWRGRQPTILFCHGASFHGRCHDLIINEALHGYHVIAPDFRGHGRSQQHPPPYRFIWFSQDLFEFIETMDLPSDDLIGIGHSMGGYALTYSAALASKRLFRSLLLFDPGIVPRWYYGTGDQKVSEIEFILRRRSQWGSIEEMISSLEKRKPFSQWSKEILRNYCTYAVDENCKLKMTPAGEHSLYQTAFKTESNIFPLIENSRFIHDIPIHVVRSSLPFDPALFQTSPTEPELAKSFSKGRDTHLKHVEHFFPMAQPDVMIEFVKEAIKE